MDQATHWLEMSNEAEEKEFVQSMLRETPSPRLVCHGQGESRPLDRWTIEDFDRLEQALEEAEDRLIPLSYFHFSQTGILRQQGSLCLLLFEEKAKEGEDLVAFLQQLLTKRGREASLLEDANLQDEFEVLARARSLFLGTPQRAAYLEIRGKHISLIHSPFFIGNQKSDANLCLSSRFVSRHHAYLLEKEGAWYLYDSGSLNRTSLNGRVLEPGGEYLLRSHDHIRFADLTLIFHSASYEDA